MTFAHDRIVLLGDDGPVHHNRHPLEKIADDGYEIFVWGGIRPGLPEFRRNQIYVCFDPLREEYDLKSGADCVAPVLLYSYDRAGFAGFLRRMREKYSGMLHTISLYFYGGTAEEFMRDENFPDAVEAFGEIVIRHETRGGAPLPSGISPRHFARRRPCWYPFEWLTLDGNGNVLQCPYCRRALTKFRGMEELKNDPALLRFHAAQLLMDFDGFPECRDCRYWLDGWLADETETVEYRPDRHATVLHEGHICRIFRRRGK